MRMAPGSSEADYKQYEKLHSARGSHGSIIIVVFWDMTSYIVVRRNLRIDLYVFTYEETLIIKGGELKLSF